MLTLRRATVAILPEETVQLIRDHVLSPQTPFQIVRRQVVLRLQQAFSVVYPLVMPLVNRVVEVLSDSPDFVVLGVLLAIVVVALQVVFLVHRIMMFWTRMAMRLVLWAAVGALVAVVWQRGPETAMRDVVVFVSKLVGYGSIVKQIWLTEYDKFSQQTNNAKRSGRSRTRKSGRW